MCFHVSRRVHSHLLGPLQTNPGAVSLILGLFWAGVKAHSNSDADQTSKLWVHFQVNPGAIHRRCERKAEQVVDQR